MKSVIILTLFPSGFTRKMASEHHSVGSWHGVSMFLFNNSFMYALAGSLNRYGICLATDKQYRVGFGLRNKCTFSDSIGSESKVSLKTLGYFSRISRRVDDATELTFCGNCLSILFI